MKLGDFGQECQEVFVSVGATTSRLKRPFKVIIIIKVTITSSYSPRFSTKFCSSMSNLWGGTNLDLFVNFAEERALGAF